MRLRVAGAALLALAGACMPYSYRGAATDEALRGWNAWHDDVDVAAALAPKPSSPARSEGRDCTGGTLAECVAHCRGGCSDADVLGKRICREGSVAECDAACDGGNRAACLERARIAIDGVRVPQDFAPAARLAKAACARGNANACDDLATSMLSGAMRPAKDCAAAVDMLARACELTHAASVSLASDGGPEGWTYGCHAPRDADAYEAKRWVEDAEIDDHAMDPIGGASACGALAGVAPERALPLIESGCRASLDATPTSTPCQALASMDPKRAAPLFEQACRDAADGARCADLMSIAPARARALLLERCRSGRVDSCAAVLGMHDGGHFDLDGDALPVVLRRLCDDAAASRGPQSSDACGRLKDLGASP